MGIFINGVESGGGGGGSSAVETYPYKLTSGELTADPTDATTTFTLATPADANFHLMTSFLVGADYAGDVPEHGFYVLKWSGIVAGAGAKTGAIKAQIAPGDAAGAWPTGFVDLTDDVAQTLVEQITTRSGAVNLATEMADFPFTVAICGSVTANATDTLTLKMYASTFVRCPVKP